MLPEPRCRAAGKSRLKPFKMDDHGRLLKDELFKWRKEKALAKFGMCYFNTVGANILISDEVIDRIVVCSHWRKITTIDDVKRETGWCNQPSWVSELGDSLMEVITKHSPPAPSKSATRKKRVDPTCTACKQPGHMSKLSFFQFILLLI